MLVQLTRRRFTLEEYHRMIEAGILAEDERVELIEGEIVDMSPIGPRHAACVSRLNRSLGRGLGERALVRVQDPVALAGVSEPQPDLAVVRPRADCYETEHPRPGDVLWLVEEGDRGRKIPLYARSGVAEAWLVDLEGERVFVYRRPAPDGYEEVRAFRRGERVSPLAFPDLSLAVDEILG